jgi:hypothetical protein
MSTLEQELNSLLEQAQRLNHESKQRVVYAIKAAILKARQLEINREVKR